MKRDLGPVRRSPVGFPDLEGSGGMGTLLLQALIDWAEAHPAIEKLSLAVLATNTAAIGLYRRFGFIEEGRRPREVKLGPDEYVNDVLMYRFV
jgi:RimJ/RimL family protein N-acetyltransferase